MMSAFISRFPQFVTFADDADREFISLTLVAVAEGLDQEMWGKLYVEGVCSLTASILAHNWFGDPHSIYASLFELLNRTVHQPSEVTT